MGTEAEVQEAWSNFFRSLTPDQRSLLTQASTASSATTPGNISVINRTEEHLASSYISTNVQQAIRARSRRVRASAIKKRPLNAFIAFRTYYSPQLSGMTQKIKSRHMQHLWAGETRKNLWTLLAKAYTDLRDNHQEPVPLDKLLMATVTEVPVIPAPVYLAKMGWELTMDDKGEKILRRASSFDINALNAEYPTQTNMSVVDLVNHCYKVHLLHRSTRVGRTTAVTFATGPSATMPAQSQPNATRDDRTFDFDIELRELLRADNEQATMPSSAFDFSIDFRPDCRPSINDVTVDQQHAFAQIPFAMHFHPQSIRS
ncbi:hypothetical protein DV736_g5948, partial [Chaetothyriales sp. CBS 134916]